MFSLLAQKVIGLGNDDSIYGLLQFGKIYICILSNKKGFCRYIIIKLNSSGSIEIHLNFPQIIINQYNK